MSRFFSKWFTDASDDDDLGFYIKEDIWPMPMQYFIDYDGDDDDSSEDNDNSEEEEEEEKKEDDHNHIMK